MASKSSKKSAKRSLAKIPTRQEYEEFSKAHQNVLIEHMDKSVRAIAEGHAMLHETMEKNHAEVTTRIDGLERKVTALGHDVRELKGEMVEVKDRLGRVEDIVVEILQRLKALEIRVAALESHVAGLESRVAGLESKWETAFPPGSLPLPQDAGERLHQLEERVAALEAHTA